METVHDIICYHGNCTWHHMLPWKLYMTSYVTMETVHDIICFHGNCMTLYVTMETVHDICYHGNCIWHHMLPWKLYMTSYVTMETVHAIIICYHGNCTWRHVLPCGLVLWPWSRHIHGVLPEQEQTTGPPRPYPWAKLTDYPGWLCLMMNYLCLMLPLDLEPSVRWWDLIKTVNDEVTIGLQGL